MKAYCLIPSVDVADSVHNFQVIILQSRCSNRQTEILGRTFLSYHNTTFIQNLISVLVSFRNSYKNCDIKNYLKIQ
jgi:hypothetical protein